ncbi:MAG TPA: HTH domain-containing protein [Candidatus Dormibacteraeota bacterium]|nr:HTH domain-containing protein [Candidatus Dormibacteraeota bacterium]
MNRAGRLVRLLRILSVVISEPGLNPLELAERAGVSERTLRRDLVQLRGLGYEVAYTGGYEVQEKLNLEGRTGHRSLGSVYEQHLDLLRKQLPKRLAAQVTEEVDSLAPAALASLFATAIERHSGVNRRARAGRTSAAGRAQGASD